MASWNVVEAELIEWLRAYEGPRFHAVLSDPPYALISIAKRFGKEGSAPAQEGSDGRYARLSGGFMGQTWDGWESLEEYQKWITEWAKLLIEKALYPGAVCMFFGGTRTFHRLGVGLENGGFEIVDCLMWLTGQGFPKSHSHTKAILSLFLQASLQGVARSHRTSEDSAGDYPDHCRLCDGPLHDALVVVRELEPSQDDVQAHIRPFSPSVEIRTDSGRTHKVSFGALSFHRAKPDCSPLTSWLTILRASLESTATLPQREQQFDKMASLGIPAAVLSHDLNSRESESNSGGGSFLPNIGAFEKAFRKRDNSRLPTLRQDSLIAYPYLIRSCDECQSRHLRAFVKWTGYGTHLKPSWEPIYLCRAPRGDKTFAQLAVEFGTGALNIDGSRIEGIKPLRDETDDNEAGMFGMGSRHPTGYGTGRWPANFVLSHHEDCIAMGETVIQNPSGSVSGEEPSEQTKHTYGDASERKPFEAHGTKVTHYRRKGRTINRFKQGMMPFGNAEGEEYETVEFAEELIERWACVPECPVRMLDDQAGELGVSGFGSTRGQIKEGRIFGDGQGFVLNETGQRIGFGDKGGPSRFFYTAKASRSEKDKGLEEFYWKRGDDGFERIDLEEWEKLDKRERAHGNIHPTCKPLELLRYLATLSLPPPQKDRTRRILVPFSGSGSEIIGAVKAGWDEVVGVEMMSIYNEMAKARLLGSIGMF